MDTKTSTLNEAHKALLKEPFFTDPKLRTIAEIAGWVERKAASGSVALKTELSTAMAESSPAADGINTVAIRLLDELIPLPVEQVSDIESCAEYLESYLISGNPPLLTNDLLKSSLGCIPGGAAFYESTTPEQLRSQLARYPSFGPERLGHEALKSTLEVDEFAPGAREAANRLLCDAETIAATILLPALAAAQGDKERERLENLYTTITVATQARVLVAPKVTKAKQAILHYVLSSPRHPQTRFFADLVSLFSPSQHYTVHGRKRGKQGVLIKIVYRELLEHVLVASSALPPAENLRRVQHALCLDHLDADELRPHPVLYKMCQLEKSTTRRPRRIDPPPVRAAVSATIADVHRTLDRVTHERNVRRGDRLVMPNRAEFDTLVKNLTDDPGAQRLCADEGLAPSAVVEYLVNRPFEEFIKHIAKLRSWQAPGRSKNHQELSSLVASEFGSRLIGPPTEEYRETEIFGALRIDLYACLEHRRPGELFADRIELCFEADGEQHFKQVANWPLRETKRRDAAKAQGILERSGGRSMTLFALHHKLLTGPQSTRITGEALAVLFENVAEHGHPWVFVRPVGCQDMRSLPRGRKAVRLEGVLPDSNLEIYVIAEKT